MSPAHANKVTEQNIKKTIDILSKDAVFIEYCKELGIDKSDYNLFIRECLDKCFSVFNRLIKEGVYSIRIFNFGNYVVKESSILTHFQRLIGAINKHAHNPFSYKLYVDAFYNQFKLIEHYKELRGVTNKHEVTNRWKHLQDIYDTISFNYKADK